MLRLYMPCDNEDSTSVLAIVVIMAATNDQPTTAKRETPKAAQTKCVRIPLAESSVILKLRHRHEREYQQRKRKLVADILFSAFQTLE